MTAAKTQADSAKGDAQKQVNEEQQKGYRGTKVDPLPNSHYTFPGPSKAEAEKEKGEASE